MHAAVGAAIESAALIVSRTPMGSTSARQRYCHHRNDSPEIAFEGDLEAIQSSTPFSAVMGGTDDPASASIRLGADQMGLALKIPAVGVARDKLVHSPVRGMPVEALIGQPDDKGRAPFVELPIVIVLQRFTDH